MTLTTKLKGVCSCKWPWLHGVPFKQWSSCKWPWQHVAYWLIMLVIPDWSGICFVQLSYSSSTAMSTTACPCPMDMKHAAQERSLSSLYHQKSWSTWTYVIYPNIHDLLGQGHACLTQNYVFRNKNHQNLELGMIFFRNTEADVFPPFMTLHGPQKIIVSSKLHSHVYHLFQQWRWKFERPLLTVFFLECLETSFFSPPGLRQPWGRCAVSRLGAKHDLLFERNIVAKGPLF